MGYTSIFGNNMHIWWDILAYMLVYPIKFAHDFIVHDKFGFKIIMIKTEINQVYHLLLYSHLAIKIPNLYSLLQPKSFAIWCGNEAIHAKPQYHKYHAQFMVLLSGNGMHLFISICTTFLQIYMFNVLQGCFQWRGNFLWAGVTRGHRLNGIMIYVESHMILWASVALWSMICGVTSMH